MRAIENAETVIIDEVSMVTENKLDKIDKLLKLSGIKISNKFNNLKVYDIKDLSTSTDKDITFFHSKKYEFIAAKTKATYCITTKSLSHILPKNCLTIEVKNVLISTAEITKIFL